MDRSQLTHALRACSGVLEKPYNLVVAGSQAILAYFDRDDDPDNPLFISQEVDIGVLASITKRQKRSQTNCLDHWVMVVILIAHLGFT